MLPIGTALPTGTITFLFTDIEGSTPLWEQHPQEMVAALQIHNAALRQAIEANGGAVFKTVGDAFQAAFPTATQALKAAIEGQLALQVAAWNELGPLRVRMGLHTGEAELDPGGDEYAVSHAKNRIGRIHSAAHGGQILLSQEAADLVRRQLPEGVSLKDLGEHHLKGMQWPEHLFQVCAPGLPQEFPSLATAITHPNNLPLQITSFIGREKEITDVCHLLKEHRLVTLTGAGGVGKTRLALRVAEALSGGMPEAGEGFKHGIWLIELAPLGDGELIPRAIVSLFGVHEDQNRSLRTALLDYLSEKQLMLLLDNCEHLIEACAELADTILRNCPGVKILASSREALGIEGEIPFYVPSLSSPDPANLPSSGDLTQYTAVALFIERAQQALPGFMLTNKNAFSIAQICKRLDGIPLAIELAAVRIKMLSLEQIAARLDDRFRLLTGGSRRALPRHQTLRALIDWSYGLLSDNERVLLRRLSAFAGGWTLEAAEVICAESEDSLSSNASSGIGLPPGDILDLLTQLVNKSLIQTVNEADGLNRFHMLETIRQYAQEKLVDSGEAEQLRDRHLHFYLQFAGECEPELRGSKLMERLGQLDTELDNLRLAFGWAFSGVDKARVESGLHLASAVGEYWYMRSIPGEGSDWLKKGLNLFPRDTLSLKTRARACYTAGFLIYFISDFNRFPEAQQLVEESLALYQACGDQQGQALAQCLLGVCLMAIYSLSSRITTPRPEYQPARALAAKGLAVCRELGDESDLALALLWNGNVAYYGGEIDAARAFCEESRLLFEKKGNQIYMGFTMEYLGFLSLTQGDQATAQRYFQKCLALAQEMKDKTTRMVASLFLGLTAYNQQDFRLMETDAQASLALSREIGNRTWRMFALRNLGIAALRQDQWRRAVEFFLEDLSLAQKTAGYEYDLQVFPMYMAGVAAGLGNFDRAARLLGAVEVQFETFFKPLDFWDQTEFDRIAASAREQLADKTFLTAWAEGRALRLDQAIQEAKEAIDF